MTEPSQDDDIKARLARIERRQEALAAGLGQVSAVLKALAEMMMTTPAAPVEASEGPDDLESLVDDVWARFAFNADAYAFWHNPHPDLDGRAPKEVARDRPGREAVRAVIRRLERCSATS